jgi:hypothetical protein
VRRVLAEPRFREAAARIGRRLDADAAAQRAVLELEALAVE